MSKKNFQNWWSKLIINESIDHRDIHRTAEKAWQASEAEQSKRIAYKNENYKRAIWEYLEIAIQHAKIADNPFEFLSNHIQAMYNTEFSVKQRATIAELQEQNAELVEALNNWQDTIKYQYTGSREAMSHLQHCDNETVKVLAKVKGE